MAFHGNGADPDGPPLDNVMVEEIASPVPEPSPVVVASFSAVALPSCCGCAGIKPLAGERPRPRRGCR